MNDDYSDIIHLPHHESTTRPHMPLSDRAAQFAPFAALTGYDSLVNEAGRLTDRRIELDEYEKEKISDQLVLLKAHLTDEPVVEITCFVPDTRKEGGEYRTITGIVRKIDEFQQIVHMMDGVQIAIEEIVEIRGRIFDSSYQLSPDNN